MKRIGFACKWIDNAVQLDGIKPTDSAKKYNTGTTTVAWLDRQATAVAEEKLWNLMVSNIAAVQRLVDKVGTLAPHLKMVRLGSDILPVFTHRSYSYFWKQTDVVSYLEKNLILVGDSARKNNVRLSFHPGQFTVLASINPGIVEKSIEEFEYHASMAAWMGYGKKFQDFKINVHISGKLGPDGIRAAHTRLSPEARNCITIENEENSWGLADCLTIGDLVPIVLDVHHNWIREGKYISPDDTQVKQVIDSWRGVRPTMHYSVSREDYLVDYTSKIVPDYSQLLLDGYKKQKLRAHSDFYWNEAVNTWAASFWENFDIMCESKSKNLGSFAFAEHAKKFTTI
jgi:UV DNA damage endonuclease